MDVTHLKMKINFFLSYFFLSVYVKKGEKEKKIGNRCDVFHFLLRLSMKRPLKKITPTQRRCLHIFDHGSEAVYNHTDLWRKIMEKYCMQKTLKDGLLPGKSATALVNK